MTSNDEFYIIGGEACRLRTTNYYPCILLKPANKERGGRDLTSRCEQESATFPQRCETVWKSSTTVAGGTFQADAEVERGQACRRGGGA